MAYYLLTYYLTDDYLARRPAFRAEHLELASDAHAKGELILGGALADPADRALLVFRAGHVGVAEAFAKKDPYVRNGLVRKWDVRLWNVVVGNEKPTPRSG